VHFFVHRRVPTRTVDPFTRARPRASERDERSTSDDFPSIFPRFSLARRASRGARASRFTRSPRDSRGAGKSPAKSPVRMNERRRWRWRRRPRLRAESIDSYVFSCRNASAPRVRVARASRRLHASPSRAALA